MGGELAIVNDARVSFLKFSSSFTPKDADLIRYLIKHGHFSPLRSTVFKFRVKAPLFVCRQWFKYTVASSHVDEQLSWNELSFRYVDQSAAQFYVPSHFRQQAKSNRQASGEALSSELDDKARITYEAACHNSCSAYHYLIELGVARELARAVLPASLYTEWVWTTSLQSLMHFIRQRLSHDAQPEISRYAQSLLAVIQLKCPTVYESFLENLL
jgi:thymidylate synthase (FAD)